MNGPFYAVSLAKNKLRVISCIVTIVHNSTRSEGSYMLSSGFFSKGQRRSNNLLLTTETLWGRTHEAYRLPSCQKHTKFDLGILERFADAAASGRSLRRRVFVVVIAVAPLVAAAHVERTLQTCENISVQLTNFFDPPQKNEDLLSGGEWGRSSPYLRSTSNFEPIQARRIIARRICSSSSSEI